MVETNKQSEEKLLHAVLFLNAKMFGLIFGLLFGIGLFIATNWLVIKGGPVVGPHLKLLGQFFPGYRVSFAGSFIGFFYGFAVGTLCGSSIGWVYNKLAGLRN